MSRFESGSGGRIDRSLPFQLKKWYATSMIRALRAFLATPFLTLGLLSLILSVMFFYVGAAINGRLRHILKHEDEFLDGLLDALRAFRKRVDAEEGR